jgi:hypothetical protein
LAAAIAVVFPIATLAQGSTHSAWTETTITKVKPEMREKFERYLKQIVTAYKESGTPWFLTLLTFAGETTEYTTIIPVLKFTDLDGPSVPAAVLGDAKWKSLSRKIDRCYTSQTRRYATPVTALEVNRKDAPAGSYWVETRTRAAQDKLNDYLEWIRNAYRPALEKANVARFQISIAVFGAEGGEIVAMRMLRNLAEIDEGPILTRALGAEAAQAVNAKGSALVLSTFTRILRVRNDLSYLRSN